MRKKILAIALAFAMTFVLAACGGGSSSSDAPAADSSAEANTGVGGIVFTIPDGWAQSRAEVGRYSIYKSSGSNYMLGASAFGEKALEDYNEWGDEKFDSVQAYYEKNYKLDKDTIKKENIDSSKLKVCDTDATYSKYKYTADGPIELNTNWMMDNTVYSIYMYNLDAYDDQGNLIEGVEPMSDELIKEYEAVVASVKAGDGNAFQEEFLVEASTSIGDITYEIPEGYSVLSLYDSDVAFQKDDSAIGLNIFMTDESMLDSIENDDGSHPKSLEEYFDADNRPEDSMIKVAGYDGFLYKYPDDNGKYYDVSADFMTENAIYHVQMDSSAYDENGELKADATELSKDDLATFDSFLASIKKK